MSIKNEAIQELLDVIQQAIKSGDWKVDGACDPELSILFAEKALKESDPLTDEDIQDIFKQVSEAFGDKRIYEIHTFARAIEKAHGIE